MRLRFSLIYLLLAVVPTIALLPAHEAGLNQILASTSMREILQGFENGTHFDASDGFESGDRHFSAAKSSGSETLRGQSSTMLYSIAACAMDKALAMVEIMQPAADTAKLHADNDPELKNGAHEHGQLVDILTELPTCCINKDEYREKCILLLEPAFTTLHKVFATASHKPEDNQYAASTMPGALLAAFKSTAAAAEKLVKASGLTACPKW